MEFISKSMPYLTKRSGISAVAATNCVMRKFTSLNQDKMNTITNYLKTPNAKVFLNLVLLQALVVFYARRELMPITSNNTAESDDESGDHNSDHGITIRAKLASLIEQTKLNGIRWIPVACGMLITADIGFDVLFHYNIERSNVRGDSFSQSVSVRSEPVKPAITFFGRVGEFIRSELTNF